MTRIAAAGKIKPLLAEAASWRLASLLLQRPRKGWLQQAQALQGETPSRWLQRAVQNAPQGAEGLYLRLFGPGGWLSPREVSYKPGADPGQLLADLSSFYQAFAFSPHTEEPVDHVSNLVDFLGFLRMKEAYARARSDEEAASIVRQGVQRLVESHLSGFLEPFAERLARCQVDYLVCTARFLKTQGCRWKQPLP